MKKYYFILLLLFLLFGVGYFKFRNLVSAPDSTNLTQHYSSDTYEFSIDLPQSFTVDETYIYQLDPNRSIPGVKFLIPTSLSEGTNLSSDSYISVENISGAINSCSAEIYLDRSEYVGFTDVGEHRYSIAYNVGAGAGNRYEETIYATPVDGGCLAVRYFIHYGVIENYEPGAVKEFKKDELLNLFDSIRRTLILK